jgi:hypothetical protein
MRSIVKHVPENIVIRPYALPLRAEKTDVKIVVDAACFSSINYSWKV